MRIVGILGGGFGLYGYLKAFYLKKYKLNTLKKYKNIINGRPDLRKINRINFFFEEINLLKKSDIIIFARRPKDQENFINKLIANNLKIKNKLFYFEKPFCSNLKKSNIYLDYLFKNKINFKISYLLIYLKWYKFFKKNSTSIEWKFFSKSLEKKDWKLNKREGGGLINYYGVHFVFLLSFLKKIIINYSYLFRNSKGDYRWLLSFRSLKKKYKLDIIINSKKENFKIISGNNVICNNKSLFLKSNYSDDRIPFIIKLIRDKNNYFKYYKKTNQLLHLINEKTIIKKK
jgi:hypothetical protein